MLDPSALMVCFENRLGIYEQVLLNHQLRLSHCRPHLLLSVVRTESAGLGSTKNTWPTVGILKYFELFEVLIAMSKFIIFLQCLHHTRSLEASKNTVGTRIAQDIALKHIANKFQRV